MDWWWILCLFLCLLPLAFSCGHSLTESGDKRKIRKLKSKLKKYEKGAADMSKIINELIGKKCKLGILGINGEVTVLDADDEWIKFEYTDKKGNKCVKIQPIDDISEIELLD